LRHYQVIIFSVFILLAGCRKGDIKPGELPETHLSIEAINLTGENRLNSEVRLSWYGTDVDGYIQGFEISTDNQNWEFTTVQDSVFIFDLEAGSDTTDVDFYVRAIDNDNNIDPTPAYLKVPLKNSPPSASFNNDRGPRDTAFCVSTFYWTASDPDGDQTIQQVYIRFNDGNWTEISTRENLISFLVDTAVSSGPATAKLYYGRNDQPENLEIDGLKVGEDNVLYLKSVDLAGTESAVDTSDVFFLKNKTRGTNTLWVSAHSLSIAADYRSFLDNQSIAYDFLDYGSDFGRKQPVYWDPTFKLILSLYPKFFMDAPASTFPNAVTGQDAVILDYMANIIQDYQSNGGKSLITAKLDKALAIEEVAVFANAFAIEDIDRASGVFRTRSNDTVQPQGDYVAYPELVPQNTQILTPIIASADADDFYRAQFDPNRGWMGDNLVATARKNGNGDLIQVFFAIELHYFHKDGNPQPVEQLIGRILKDEF
tara:strand:- start:2131 stop:3582 length:1452 start_codon:yes stop_codon:yes gene_type:complete